MNTNKTITALIMSASFALTGCSEQSSSTSDTHADGTHTHADGTVHEGPDHADPDTSGSAPDDHGHAHGEEVALPSATTGDVTIELAQGHGAVKAGQESHLVVKLPFNDGGSTIVRAWIGSEDRTMSYVGKGEYAPSHDDYDIHTTAPDPLADDAMWWIEIEKPSGEKTIFTTTPNR